MQKKTLTLAKKYCPVFICAALLGLALLSGCSTTNMFVDEQRSCLRVCHQQHTGCLADWNDEEVCALIAIDCQSGCRAKTALGEAE